MDRCLCIYAIKEKSKGLNLELIFGNFKQFS